MLAKVNSMKLYQQLTEIILNKITTKEWPSNYKIPTEEELCEIYKVSRITVRNALLNLERSGYICRKPGRGTFVQDSVIDQKLARFYSFSEEIEKKGLVHKTILLSFEVIQCDAIVREKLTLGENELVFQINRLRFVGDIPYALETSYVPYKHFPSLSSAMVVEKGLYNSMRFLGIYPDRARETIGAIILSAHNAKLLQTSTNSAALSLKRSTWSKAIYVEYCESIIRGDKFTYTIDMN
jgi:GntR family transcriptional regulator